MAYFAKDYTELLKKDNSWEVLYNYSPIRENLLEWYDFSDGASLLEVDAGFGALTGLFLRKGCSVTAICKNEQNADIVKDRYAGSDNLDVVSSLDEVLASNDEVHKSYDYIVLVDMDMNQELLAKCEKMLSDNGTIIVAIENEMSLKKLSSMRTVSSLTKDELCRMLKEAGLGKQDFYYPLPDHILMNTLYSDDYLPKAGDIRGTVNSYDEERFQAFNEEYVFDKLCRDGKFDYFANSFLVFASR